MDLTVVKAQAMRATELGVDRPIRIFTQMGHPLAEGVVQYPSALGLCVNGAFYAEDLHYFVPTEETLQEATKRAGTTTKLGHAHPDHLPVDIKKAVVTTTDLSDEQIQQIMTKVGAVILHHLQEMGMRADAVYKRVDQILQAVQHGLRPEAQDVADPEDADD